MLVMAKQEISRSEFIARLKKKASAAFQNAKKAPPSTRGARLPAGLVNATAVINRVKFGLTEKKKDEYFMLLGTTVTPSEHKGIPCSFAWFMTESQYKSRAQKWELFCGELQNLGINTSEMESPADIVEAMEQFASAKPVIKFNTWKPKDDPNADVQLLLQGLDENQEQPDASDNDVIVDDDPEDEEVLSDFEIGQTVVYAARSGPVKAEIKALEGDKATIKFLEGTNEGKQQKGIDTNKLSLPENDDVVEDADAEIVEDTVEEVAEEAPEEYVPDIGDIYDFKTGPGKKSEVEVISVNKNKKTVDVKFLDGPNKGKPLKGVAFEKLSS